MTRRTPQIERERPEGRARVRPSWVVIGVLVAAFLAALALYGSHVFTIFGRLGLSIV